MDPGKKPQELAKKQDEKIASKVMGTDPKFSVGHECVKMKFTIFETKVLMYYSHLGCKFIIVLRSVVFLQQDMISKFRPLLAVLTWSGGLAYEP
jgi:hypothetical protein